MPRPLSGPLPRPVTHPVLAAVKASAAGATAGPEEVVLGLDVGGTRMKAVVMTAAGAVLHTASAPTGAARGPDAAVENVLGFAAELSRRFRPVAVGLAVPGRVDETAGICAFAANLGWREVPVREWAEEELGVPVALSHDVRAGGVAEARLGAGRGCRASLFVPVGTGVAAAILVDGRALNGGHGGAGELGHVVVRPGGEACACGGHGCVEAYASAAAIARRYRDASGRAASAAEVGRRAEAGDPRAAGVWREAVTALADGLTAAVSLLDPRRVVIGGGLAREPGGRLCAELGAALAERLPFQVLPELVPAALGNAAGSLGAGLLARDAWIARRANGRAAVRPVLAAPAS